ncbi:hypothetical protein [Gloeocapsa sp. PCC 7428]|uniref:hypothetical protein n=1 Tax=Gloeocapsa sp. PCC 7428 TaxID=1173026 RepID=UPI001E38EBB2|nr:hypothetical protein [Gloeocapsa sp. PCC 7428]
MVISIPALNQDRALATLIPHTTSPRDSRFGVQNIITIPHAKLLRKLGRLTPERMVKVEDIVRFWLGFEEKNLAEDK